MEYTHIHVINYGPNTFYRTWALCGDRMGHGGVSPEQVTCPVCREKWPALRALYPSEALPVERP